MRMQLSKIIAGGVVSMLLLVGAGCEPEGGANQQNTTSTGSSGVTTSTTSTGGSVTNTSSRTILQNINDRSDLSAARAVLQVSGLSEAMSTATSTYTMFVPSNDAFKKVGTSTLESLLQSNNRQALVSLLAYHIVPGNLSADSLKNGQELETGVGVPLRVTRTGNDVRLNNTARITETIPSSNGTIHVIDTVLVPSATSTRSQ